MGNKEMGNKEIVLTEYPDAAIEYFEKVRVYCLFSGSLLLAASFREVKCWEIVAQKIKENNAIQ